ncbi:antibiotic biosynthesis monooxygenase [Pseudomonas sp. NPDC089547]|uniref:antibiotic biosynthesis monooxygenase n=1 Tax=Pseudomonas sp. NPDC089547 TaxID=3390652 RepID=UPI003D055458
MLASPNPLWFTQMIEYQVPSMCQQALVQALVVRSEVLAARCEGLQGVSIQASDDGSRVLQYLQWQSRQAWSAAAVYFVEEPFLELLAQHQASGLNFAAYQTLRSLVRGTDGGLHCEVGEPQAYQGA